MLANGFHAVPKGKVATIVTHLEMQGCPALRQVSLPSGVEFREVDADADWFRDVFRRVGSLKWLWYGRLKLENAALDALLADPKVEHYTLSKNGRDEALLELDYRQEGDCELAYFGVTPALIGTGSGRYLMNEAITQAWAKPIRRLHVHTCTMDSPQALAFYQRSGFSTVRQEVEIDDDPRVLGILPRSAGPHVPIYDL